jgi:LysM repeat protein
VVPTDKVDPDAVAVYTVQPGDTMLALSERLDTPIPALKKLNGILDGDLILVGQKIVYFRPVEAQQ